MEGNAGKRLRHHPRHAEVLHDHRIDAAVGRVIEHLPGGLEFGGEDQGVEGEIAFAAAGVQPGHHFRQIRF